MELLEAIYLGICKTAEYGSFEAHKEIYQVFVCIDYQGLCPYSQVSFLPASSVSSRCHRLYLTSQPSSYSEIDPRPTERNVSRYQCVLQ